MERNLDEIEEREMKQNVNEFSEILGKYQNQRNKDILFQIFAGIVALFLFLVNLMNLYLIFILLQGDIPRILLIRLGIIYTLLIVVSILEFFRLNLFHSWNSTLRSEKCKIVEIQVKIIINIRKIIAMELIVLFLTILFISGYLLFRAEMIEYINVIGIPITLTNYGIAFQTFNFTASLTIAIGVLQLFLSVMILSRWFASLKKINKVMNSIEKDFPNLGDLIED